MRPTESTEGYVLHCKNIPYLDQSKLIDLPAANRRLRDELVGLLGWVNDPARYECSATTDLKVSTLSEADHAVQLRHGKIGPEADPRGTCKPLKRPEHSKRRFRGLQWPELANLMTADCVYTEFLPYVQRHSAILRGRYTIDLDWSAYFDQFALDEEVRRYFAFKTKGGQIYSMKVLPMGLKHSVSVAHTATLQLLNFAHQVYSEAYVDNVRMISDAKDAIVHDAATLVCRCVEAGVTINEIDVAHMRTMDPRLRMHEAKRLVEPLVKSKGPWLGEVYDYEHKLIDLADKTRDKVRRCLDAKRPTFRTFAAAVGVLQYASRTLDMPLAQYYAALRAIAAVAWLLEQRPHLWDVPMPAMCPAVTANLRRWRDDILASGPRKVTKPKIPSVVIIVDASDAGWGALSVDDLGRIKYARQRWSDRDKRTFDTGSSVRAEPEGIYRACCRFVGPKQGAAIVLTDSAASAGALTRGHSRSFWMNEVSKRLLRVFPHTSFTFQHTPGVTNPADGISRELLEPSATDRLTALRLAEEARTSFEGGRVSRRDTKAAQAVGAADSPA